MEEYKEIFINRKKTSFQELLDIIDTVGGYPVQAKDFDGTTLLIFYGETDDGKMYCNLYEPYDDKKALETTYFEDGSVTSAFI